MIPTRIAAHVGESGMMLLGITNVFVTIPQAETSVRGGKSSGHPYSIQSIEIHNQSN
jgi:hypothetical protein